MYANVLPLVLYWYAIVFVPLLHIMNTLDIDGVETFVDFSMRAIASSLPEFTVTYYVYPSLDASGGDWGDYEFAPPDYEYCTYVPLVTHWPSYAVCDLLKIASIEVELQAAAVNSAVNTAHPLHGVDTHRPDPAEVAAPFAADENGATLVDDSGDFADYDNVEDLSPLLRLVACLPGVFVLYACVLAGFLVTRELIRSLKRWFGLNAGNCAQKFDDDSLESLDGERLLVTDKEDVNAKLGVSRYGSVLGDEPANWHEGEDERASEEAAADPPTLASALATLRIQIEAAAAEGKLLRARRRFRAEVYQFARECSASKQDSSQSTASSSVVQLELRAPEMVALKAELEQLKAQRAQDLQVYTQRCSEAEARTKVVTEQLNYVVATFQAEIATLRLANPQYDAIRMARLDDLKNAAAHELPLNTPSLTSSSGRFSRSPSLTPPPETPRLDVYSQADVFESL